MGSSIQSQLGQPGGMNGTLFPGRRELFLPRIGSETAKGIQEMEEETLKFLKGQKRTDPGMRRGPQRHLGAGAAPPRTWHL